MCFSFKFIIVLKPSVLCAFLQSWVVYLFPHVLTWKGYDEKPYISKLGLYFFKHIKFSPNIEIFSDYEYTLVRNQQQKCIYNLTNDFVTNIEFKFLVNFPRRAHFRIIMSALSLEKEKQKMSCSNF